MEGHESIWDNNEVKLNILLERSGGGLKFPCLLCYKPFARVEEVQYHVKNHFVEGKTMKGMKREYEESKHGPIAWRGPVTERIKELDFFSHPLQLEMAQAASSLRLRLANQNDQYQSQQYLEHDDHGEEHPFSNDNNIETDVNMIDANAIDEIDFNLKL